MPEVKMKWELSVTTIAVLVGFLVQGAGGVWFFAEQKSQVGSNKDRIAVLERQVELQRNEREDFIERMVRVETQLDSLAKQSSEQRQLLQAILSELRSTKK